MAVKITTFPVYPSQEGVPEGYIRNKLNKIMKKPPGRPKGSVTLGGMPALLLKSAEAKQAQEAAQTAKKIVASDKLSNEEVEGLAKDALEARPARGDEDATMERRTTLMAMIYRLQIRGLDQQQISQQLNMAPSVVRSLQAEVLKQTRLDPKKLDIGFYMGESLAFFQEIRQMALLMSADGTASRGEKMNAMRVALDAEHRKNEFLTKIGVYSPQVLHTIERWIVNTSEGMTSPPQQREKVNLAAALGKVMATRNREAEDVPSREA